MYRHVFFKIFIFITIIYNFFRNFFLIMDKLKAHLVEQIMAGSCILKVVKVLQFMCYASFTN